MLSGDVALPALRRSPAFWATAVSAVLGVTYLIWTPRVPDLAAQTARAEVVRTAGNIGWWTGWFGGISMPSYSLLAPATMALIGVEAVGFLAVLFGAVAFARLVEGMPRPRAGAIAFAMAGAADVLDGRVTFAAGAAIGAWALVAARARRPLVTALLAAGSFVLSPLAGLFLGVIFVAVAAIDPSRRVLATASAALLTLVGLVNALLLPGVGTMPTSFTDIIPAGICCLIVLVACRTNRLIRLGAIVAIASLILFAAVPLAIGGNATRLAWLCGAPVVVTASRWRLPALIAAALALVSWPMFDLAKQLSAGAEPSASAAFYQPLRDALAAQQRAAGPAGVGQRLEVIDPSNHWASVYLASGVPLARGWDRQADHADNPLFYSKTLLTPTTYRAWLQELAVGWVAQPHGVSVDYAAKAEDTLVTGGLPYLRPVWANHDWTLYAVSDPAPLARGAQVIGIQAGGVIVRVSEPAWVQMQVRWSPYLEVRTADGTKVSTACVAPHNGWTDVFLPSAGTFRITGRVDIAVRLRDHDNC